MKKQPLIVIPDRISEDDAGAAPKDYTGMDQQIRALAVSRGIPAVTRSAVAAAPAAPTAAPAPVAKEKPEKVTLELPPAFKQVLMTAAFNDGASVQYLLLKALHDSGKVAVPEELLVKDRRKRR